MRPEISSSCRRETKGQSWFSTSSEDRNDDGRSVLKEKGKHGRCERGGSPRLSRTPSQQKSGQNNCRESEGDIV
ncbi:hypothetical protein F2P81_024573 [Scophthalmus maximus]|uniref:Uncharacterized protein n=1 Tax=Scophthalmus maximus TaxID=52904 RepID=A0A6A4RPS2_SCOMX|nr:hypothetical protein F2P81_024573 [Scophthalmus maximus]